MASEYPTIAFIGGGNMAASLVGGLVADGWDPNRIHVSDPDAQRRESLGSQFSVHTGEDNQAAVQKADVVVLAVKPQVLKQVAEPLREAIRQGRTLVISIAAGIRAQSVGAWVGENTPIVRAMPNTPALVQSGATALYANAAVNEDQRDLAESILRAVGLALWVDDEAMMDAVTALSGSGPAYFFLVMEAIEQAATELGIPADKARLLTVQTAFGAAKMALESDEGPATLRERVTSPGGTTERALETLEQGGLRDLFKNALTEARKRSEELAEILGGQ
jgi:pyrroline-5-carboxylate reductase